MRVFTADFETTTQADDCRVWAYGICEVNNPDYFVYGSTIEEFFLKCRLYKKCKMYFHNLAFDGSFIMDYLLKHGWRWIANDEEIGERTFTTIISDMNVVYKLKLYFNPDSYVEILDSYKIIPLSIHDMAYAFDLPIKKGEIDYEAYRCENHILTDDEISYLRNDVEIAARALSFMFSQGLKKMTAASNALADYKTTLHNKDSFRYLFPVISNECDSFIRKSYKGGFCYANPKYAGKILGEGIGYDVNSLYPSVMAGCSGEILPYGEPVEFYGEPEYDEEYPLWVASLTCYFKVKKDHIPCIQLKHTLKFIPTEYVTDSIEEQTLVLTSVDYKLFTEQYDVQIIDWNGGYKFKASDNLFKAYVNKWGEIKAQATIEHNSGLRYISKRQLNSLYGKFATQPKLRSRKPVIENDILRYRDLPEEEREPIYLPVGTFITAWARYKTVSACQAAGDRFVYADTDSCKVIGLTPLQGIDIDDVKLGAWKDEGHFAHIKALGAKTYCTMPYTDIITNEFPVEKLYYVKSYVPRLLEIHVSGLPESCHNQVTLDNFKSGTTYSGKLKQKHVSGGIVLYEDTHTIRGR